MLLEPFASIAYLQKFLSSNFHISISKYFVNHLSSHKETQSIINRQCSSDLDTHWLGERFITRPDYIFVSRPLLLKLTEIIKKEEC